MTMQPVPKAESLKDPRGQNAPAKAAPGQATRRSRLMASFFGPEEGAVTVDWVVLTAAIVGIGFAVIIPIGYSTESSVVELSGTVSDVSTGYVSTTP